MLDLTVVALGCFILGFGFWTNGGQLVISALPGAIYPPAIRVTGAGWATGIGRLGNISGALLGGVLLSFGWSSKQMLLALAAAPFLNAVLATMLGWVRENKATVVESQVEAALNLADRLFYFFIFSYRPINSVCARMCPFIASSSAARSLNIFPASGGSSA